MSLLVFYLSYIAHIDIVLKKSNVNRYCQATPDTSGASPLAPPFPASGLRWIHLSGTKAGLNIDPGTAPVWLNEATDLGLLPDFFTMDEAFFKSMLPAQDSFELDDSSLALPAAPNPRSSWKVNPKDRSERVQQQVQLTLARRARKSVPKGNASAVLMIISLLFCLENTVLDN